MTTMRKLMLSCAVAALAMSFPVRAFADEAMAANPVAIISSAAAAETERPAGAMEAKDLIGRDVTNTQDQTLGEIESVYVDPKGNVRQMIVAVGGFLGVGERGVAIDWKDAVVTDNGKKIAVNATKDQLMTMPAYTYAKPSQQGTVFTDE